MLLCVCLWVCNLCVNECVFLAHCANVCVALILVFPLTIPTSPLLFSPHFWWLHTNPLSILTRPLFPHRAIILNLPHFPACHFPLPPHFHPPALPFMSPLTDTSHLVSVTNPPRLSLHFSSLLFRSSFPLPPSPCPLGSPPFLPSSLSLSHSALCLARSGWAAPRWLRVCVHSGACRASPPPGLTTRFCLSPLNSAASPPLPPLLSWAFHHHRYYLPTLHDSSSHLVVDTFAPSPSRLLT